MMIIVILMKMIGGYMQLKKAFQVQSLHMEKDIDRLLPRIYIIEVEGNL